MVQFTSADHMSITGHMHQQACRDRMLAATLSIFYTNLYKVNFKILCRLYNIITFNVSSSFLVPGLMYETLSKVTY